MDEFDEDECLKLQALRRAIADAERQIDAGQAENFTQNVVERVKKEARRVLKQERK